MQSTILENGTLLPYLRLHTPWGLKDRALMMAVLMMLLFLVTGCAGFSSESASGEIGVPAGTTFTPVSPAVNSGAIYNLNGNLIW